jgi:hypothetical protein
MSHFDREKWTDVVDAWSIDTPEHAKSYFPQPSYQAWWWSAVILLSFLCFLVIFFFYDDHFIPIVVVGGMGVFVVSLVILKDTL